MKIGNKVIRLSNPSYIIAEIGINHEGNFDTCKQMILEAFSAGANAVKLQTFKPAEHYLPGTESYKTYKGTMFSDIQITKIFRYAKDLGIDIFSSCGDFRTIDLINKLDPVAFKVSSGMIENYPIINYLLRLNKPVIFSTGMSENKEINKLVQLIRKSKNRNVCLMHCVSLYPVPKYKNNLECIRTLKNKYKFHVGFSDHSLGSYASELAVSIGARIIEKHFTLDSKKDKFDHKISLNAKAFRLFVKRIRNVEKILGSGKKELCKEEKINAFKFKRYIVANKTLKIGQYLSLNDIALMRVENGKKGLSPSLIENISGKKIKRNITKYELIKASDLY